LLGPIFTLPAVLVEPLIMLVPGVQLEPSVGYAKARVGQRSNPAQSSLFVD
jgi:hypothetical protein